MSSAEEKKQLKEKKKIEKKKYVEFIFGKLKEMYPDDRMYLNADIPQEVKDEFEIKKHLLRKVDALRITSDRKLCVTHMEYHAKKVKASHFVHALICGCFIAKTLDVKKEICVYYQNEIDKDMEEQYSHCMSFVHMPMNKDEDDEKV